MDASPLYLVSADDDPSDAVLQAESAYWDAHVQGQDTTATAIDPSIRQTIEALSVLDTTAPPAPTFVADLEATLLGRHPSFTPPRPVGQVVRTSDDDPPGPHVRHALMSAWPMERQPARQHAHPPGVSVPPSAAQPIAPGSGSGPFPRSTSGLATAVMLLATLCLLIVVLGIPRDLGDRHPAQQDVVHLAASPSGLDLVLPRELLPPTNPAVASLSDYTLPAGETTAWDAADGACCPGLRLLTVLEGALTLRPAGASYLVRDHEAEPTAPLLSGTPVTLQPGDAILLPYDQAFSSSNADPTETRFLDVLLIAGFAPLRTAPSGWVWHPDSDVADTLTIPERPVTLRLEQVELRAGDVRHPPPHALTQLGITVADDVPLQIQDTDEIANRTAHPVTVTVVDLMEGSG